MKRRDVAGRFRHEWIRCVRNMGSPAQGWTALLLVLACVALPAWGAQVRVPSGQMVRVRLHNLLTTENVEKDDTVDFDVVDDVIVAGHVVIAKGAPARGKIVRVKGAGKKKAKDAEVVFSFSSVTAVDNQQIPVRAVPAKPKKRDAKENEVPVNSPIPGMAERVIGAEKGREFACYTDTDSIINAPEASATAPAAPPTPATTTPAPPPAAATAPATGVQTPAPSALLPTMLGAEPASVDFTTDPPGADILIDGSFVGNSPSNLRIAPGRHTIDLRLSGYRSWSRTMTVEPASHPTIRVTLVKD